MARVPYARKEDLPENERYLYERMARERGSSNIWLAIVAPLFAVGVLVLAILPEERHLEARFGEEYLAYKDRTRRWFWSVHELGIYAR